MPFQGKRLVSPPAPPMLMGSWFLDKCQMPLLLALRLKKLTHDVGGIEPESLFLSAIYFEKSWCLAARIQAEYHAPGKELQGYSGSARVMDM